MSRLLVLLPSVPVPLDAGAKIRNHGLLRLLSEDHEVDAIAFGSKEDQAAMAKLARRAIVVRPPTARTTARRAIDLARSKLPDMALRLSSPELARQLRCLLKDNAYDAVQAEGIEMAPYLRAVEPARRVYDAHNAEFLLQRRLASAGRPFARAYSRIQWRRLERFEREVVRNSRLTLAVSNHDANQLAALGGPAANVQVVPNAVDSAEIPFCPPMGAAQPNLLFVGKLDFRPNAEAIGWFLSEVFGQLPEARLFAVGDSPPRWLVEAGQHDPRIAVTGYVVEERPYFERCAAMLLPLQSGGGSRLKALFAMASGLPIVSTRLGMEGLDAEPDTHFLLAETAQEWVGSVQRLLADGGLQASLARRARQLVEQRYDWSVIRAQVRSAYSWL